MADHGRHRTLAVDSMQESAHHSARAVEQIGIGNCDIAHDALLDAARSLGRAQAHDAQVHAEMGRLHDTGPIRHAMERWANASSMFRTRCRVTVRRRGTPAKARP